jgi:hypothetical protein
MFILQRRVKSRRYGVKSKLATDYVAASQNSLFNMLRCSGTSNLKFFERATSQMQKNFEGIPSSLKRLLY